MRKAWVGVVFAALLAAPLRAQETVATQDPPKKEAKKTGAEKQVAKLAEKYGVSEAEIRALRDKKMGWGEIGHALAIAEKAKVPVPDVLNLRESGMGWGEIAKKYGFKLGEVTGKAKAIEKEGLTAEKLDGHVHPKHEKAEKKKEGHPKAEGPGKGSKAHESGHGAGHDGGHGDKHSGHSKGSKK